MKKHYIVTYACGNKLKIKAANKNAAATEAIIQAKAMKYDYISAAPAITEM